MNAGSSRAELPTDDWLEIGRIVAPQGLDGAVRVYPDTDFPERFLEPGDRWIWLAKQPQPKVIQLLSGRYIQGKGLYVLKLKGVTSREQAEALREARLLVPRSDRLPTEVDEFHVGDLVGLQVKLQATGQVIGTVVDMYAAGNDLLAIQLNAAVKASPSDDPVPNKELDGSAIGSNESKSRHPDERKRARRKSRKKPVDKPPILIPFVYAIVPVVDLEAGYVEIDPPSGLLPNLD